VFGHSALAELPFSTPGAAPPNVFAYPTGVAANANVSPVEILASALILPDGVQAYVQVGFLDPVGVIANGTIGEVIIFAQANVPATGLQDTGFIGDVIISASAITGTLVGLESTLELGDTFQVFANADVLPTTVFATGEAGQVTATGIAIIPVIGVKGTLTVKPVIIKANSNILVSPMPVMSGQINGTVIIWSQVDPATNNVYSAISPSPNTTWGQIEPNQTAVWEDIIA
tara:strand:+ start:6014 stop:6703 length:690 start_codon:yes stop_codon:yes gene_type:complete